jgi:SNF2 family DNA or RNA helicase
MRSGKTKAVIDTACYNARYRELDGVLVIAPNGVHVNWIIRELPKHHWREVPHCKMVWNAVKARNVSWREAFAHFKASNKLAWFAVNCDAFQTKVGKQAVAEFLKSRKRVLLVVDESHEFGTPGAKRTRAVRALESKTAMRRILSGTAVDESPLKAFSQYEILSKGALGFTRYQDFKDRYAVEEEKRNWKTKRTYKVISEYVNQEELRERMAQWSSVVLREDCDDMPELIRAARPFEMLPEQRKVFDNLVDGMMQRLESGEHVSPSDGGALVIRLQQVSSGYVVDEDGDIHQLVKPELNPRLEALRAELILARGKTIIWCRFREEIRLVTELLRRMGRNFVEYHGGTKADERSDAIDAFQNDPSVTEFVGQPRAGGQGLDLSAGDDIVWFSHTFSAIERKQADERATQLGGRRIGVADLVALGTPDERILEKQEEKAQTADYLSGRGLKNFLRSMENV